MDKREQVARTCCFLALPGIKAHLRRRAAPVRPLGRALLRRLPAELRWEGLNHKARRTEVARPPGGRALPCVLRVSVHPCTDAHRICALARGPLRPIFCPTQFRRHPMSIRPVIETRRAQPHVEGAGVHLHRAFGFQDPTEADPFLLFDDFRGDRPRDYMAGFPVAPAPGDRDDHLCAGRDGGAWRQPWQPGHPWAGIAPADDGGAGHPASGDAEGRCHGPDAWLPAVGQPAARAEDDGAALSGHCRAPNCRSGSRMTAPAFAW